MSKTIDYAASSAVEAALAAVRAAERQAEAVTIQGLDSDAEFCPTCQRPFPHRANRFSTGQVVDPSGTREVDSPLDPEGQTGYRVIQRLALGEEPANIAADMALTLGQVEGMLRHLNKARNLTITVRRKLARGEM